jgi:eukaryotic-like serine/threonine-protein kinase
MLRLRQEATVLASLNHPNIAAIHGLEDSGPTHALVMELVDGPTLADRIRQGPIPAEEAVKIGKQVCEALEYAHERGIVHCDLKPSNVKVTQQDAVKLLDFGLARAMDGKAAPAGSSDSPTRSRMETEGLVLAGTPAYMSPEQAKGKFADRRVDIWAFGCVLFEMLSGKPAFIGETVTDTLAAVIREEPDWSQLPAATPATLRALLRRCLKKDPLQRLRDIGDARIALGEALAGPPEPDPGNVIVAAASRWPRILGWAIPAAGAVALVMAGMLSHREMPVEGPAVRFQIALPANAVMGPAGSFALSPDGRNLAFFAGGADRTQELWTRSLDSLEARPLPGGGSHGSNPAPFSWSPDDRYISFDTFGHLSKIAASGGPSQTLCDVRGNAAGSSWNRDGDILFGDDLAGVIMRVAASGGTASAVTALDSSRGEILHTLPWFLPDGRHFLYLRISSRAEDSGVYLGSLDVAPRDQETRRLVETEWQPIYVPSSNGDAGQLLYLRDGTLLAQPFDAGRLELTGEPVKVAEHVGNYRQFGFFSATGSALVYRTSGGGESQLTWFDAAGKAVGTLGEPGVYATPAFSPDGTRAAISRLDPESGRWSLWLFNSLRGTAARFTFGARNARFPVWSPDGTRVFFASDSNGASDIYEKAANGANEEEPLLKSGDNKSPTSVSPDGRFLLYIVSSPERKFSLAVLPLSGGEKPIAFPQTQFNEMDGHFSPNGRLIAYRSDESGRYEIYVRTFSPDSGAVAGAGGKWQISYDGGVRPHWSQDGKRLYYLTPAGRVMVVAVTTSPSFHADKPKALFPAPPQSERLLGTGDYTVDGKRFLFPLPQASDEQPPFTVVLHWQAELKK